MKQLGIISFGAPTQEEIARLEERKAARAIVFDEEKNIAMLFVSKNGYHKLPGGGIEANESKEEALRRECREEIGCEINILQEVGSIAEYRMDWNVNQESFCWIASLVGKKGESQLTQLEEELGFQIEWMPLEKAIETMQNEKPIDYMGTFVEKRDLLFLQEAQKLLS